MKKERAGRSDQEENMKKGKKITAMILALVLAVCGLPVSPVASAEGATPVTATLPETTMRLIQKATHTGTTVTFGEDGHAPGGYDATNKVLTMSLQVKPTQDGYLPQEGVLAFRVDSDVLTPLTHPKTGSGGVSLPISPGTGHVAVVASDGNTLMDSFMQRSSVERVGSGNFDSVMNTDGTIDNAKTFYLVAKEATGGFLNCYLQFATVGIAKPEVGADGYITVMDLDFQCNNIDQLFASSIQVATDAAQVRAIQNQFPYWEQTSGMSTTAEALTELAKYNNAAQQPDGASGPVYGPLFFRATSKDEAKTVWSSDVKVQVTYTSNTVTVTGEGTNKTYSLPEIDALMTETASGTNPPVQLAYVQTVDLSGMNDSWTEAEEESYTNTQTQAAQEAYNALRAMAKYQDVTMSFSTEGFTQDSRKISVSLAAGGAGIIEKIIKSVTTTIPVVGEVTIDTPETKSGTYYYEKPVVTNYWGDMGTLQTWDTIVTTALHYEMENPGVWYENIEKTYTFTNFVAGLTNTYTDQQLKDEAWNKDPSTLTASDYQDGNADPDFEQRKNDSGIVVDDGAEPRYIIPTTAQYAASKTTDWDYIPQRWVQYKEALRMPLKYRMDTEVTGKSISSPISDVVNANGNKVSAFLQNVSWSFMAGDGSSAPTMDAYVSQLTTAGYTLVTSSDATEIPTSNPNTGTFTGSTYKYKAYEVEVTAVPSSGDESLLGMKLWKIQLYNGADTVGSPTYTPLGVTLDMLKLNSNATTDALNAGLSYEYRSGTTRESRTDMNVILPQLHVTSTAANRDGLPWHGLLSDAEYAHVYFRPTYTYEGVQYPGATIPVRLYRAASIPTDIVIDAGDLPVLTDADKTVDVWVGKDGGFTEGLNDAPVTKVINPTTGQTTEYRQDPFSTGTVIYATLYDQYGIPYSEALSLEIVPDESEAEVNALKTAISKKGGIPFSITHTQGESASNSEAEVKPDSQFAYTIQYTDDSAGGQVLQRNANDVVPGSYLLKATYQISALQTKTVSRKLKIHKTDDRLTYISSGFNRAVVTGSTAETDQTTAAGQTVNVKMMVPAYSEKESVRTRTERLSIKELANQWRVDTHDTDPQRFDILPEGALREGGVITLDKIKTSGYTAIEFSLLDGSGNPTSSYPEGVDITNLVSRGEIKYDYRVRDGQVMGLGVKVSYSIPNISVSQPVTTSVYQKYIITFSREDLHVADVRLQGFTDKKLTIIVPDDSYEGTGTSTTLNPVPYDQYNDQWRWSTVKDEYWPSYVDAHGEIVKNILNGSAKDVGWRVVVFPDDVAALNANAGVTIGTDPTDSDPDHMNVVTVKKNAQPITFRVYMEFGNGWKTFTEEEKAKGLGGTTILSNSGDLWTIEIKRAESTPKTIANYAYYYNKTSTLRYRTDAESSDVNRLNAPAVGESAIVCTPTLTVMDQYADQLVLQGASNPNNRATYTVTYAVESVSNSTGGTIAAQLEDRGLTFEPATGQLTVNACAKPCVVRVSATVTVGGNRSKKTPQNEYAVINIYRADSKTREITDVYAAKSNNQKLDYQVSDQLKAKGKNQYGEGEEFTDPSALEWTLDQVKQSGGTILKRLEDGTGEATGEIPLSSGKYSGGGVNLSTTGELTFSPTTDADKVPVSFVVTARDKKNPSAYKQVTFTVESHPEAKEIILDMNGETQFTCVRPDGGVNPTQTVELRANVVDQYNVMRKDWAVIWAPEGGSLPAGITRSGNKLTIGTDVVFGTQLTMVASYENLTTKEFRIYIKEENEDNYVTTRVEIVSLTNRTGTAVTQPFSGTVAVDLPEKEGVTTADYTITGQVIHNYDDGVWRGRQITWSVVSVLGHSNNAVSGVASIIPGQEKSFSSQLRISSTQAAIDELSGGGSITVTLQGECDGKTAQVTFGVKLADDRKPVSALASRDSGTYLPKDGLPVLRPKGDSDEGDNVVTITAEVYDQYGLLLTPVSGHETDANVVIRMVESSISGSREFTQTKKYATDGVNKGELSVGYKMPDSTVTIEYYPEAVGTSAKRELPITFDIGTLYPDKLVLFQGNDSYPYANVYEAQVPELGADPDAFVMPTEAAWKTQALSLRAEVLAQNDTWLQDMANRNGANIRPIWQLHGNYTNAIQFDETMDVSVHKAGDSTHTPEMEGADAETGAVTSEEVTLRISSSAVPQDRLTQNYQLDLTTNKYQGQAEFTLTQQVTLKRNASTATYLMLEDSAADGSWTIPVKRPTLEQGTLSYTVNPQVFDQYGYLMDQITLAQSADLSLDLNLDPLTANNEITVVPLYPADAVEDEETHEMKDPDGNPAKVIGYEIYSVEYLEIPPEEPAQGEEPSEEPAEPEYEMVRKEKLASFDRLTGTITLTNHCTPALVPELKIDATYGGLTKRLTVPIQQEDIYPAEVEFDPKTISFVLESGDLTEAENLTQNVEPEILDQYGYPYNGVPFLTWVLYLPQAAGETEYRPYAETILQEERDEDGNVTGETVVTRTADERTLVMLGSSSSATLVVRQGNYLEPVQAVVWCQAQDEKHLTDTTRRSNAVMSVSVSKKAPRPSSGGYYVPDGVTVTFDVGRYGRLLGTATLETDSGKYVDSAPLVKSQEGYGFFGWSLDKVTVVDPTTVRINANTTFYAVYRNVADSAFVTGYGDGTVRPNQNVTRAEAVTMIVRGLGGYDENYYYGTSFPDITPSNWFANIIAYAKTQGIASGYEDGTFRPENPVTRAEAAKLLVVAAGLSLDATENFTDVPANKWYAPYVAALKAAGVANGYTDGTYRPDNQITRAEMIALVVALTNNSLDEAQRINIMECAYCPFTDLSKDSWAYAYILRAAGIA